MAEDEYGIEETQKKLEKLGKTLGFIPVKNKRIGTGGRTGFEIDHVWFYEIPSNLPGFDEKYFGKEDFKLPVKGFPVVGFEIEGSWRTSKHIKGNVVNLLSLSPTCGVILFKWSEEGWKGENEPVEEGKQAFNHACKTTQKIVKRYRGVSKIIVWTDTDLDNVLESMGID